jgi:hypothetical protein
MGRKKSPTEILLRAKEKGSGRDTRIVDGNPVFTKLQRAVEKRYQNRVDLWHEYVYFALRLTLGVFANPLLNRYARKNSGASPYDLESLKGFVRVMAYGIEGAEGIDEACKETVRKYWNDFTAAWRRANPEIPREITRSVTNVCLLCAFLS